MKRVICAAMLLMAAASTSAQEFWEWFPKSKSLSNNQAGIMLGYVYNAPVDIEKSIPLTIGVHLNLFGIYADYSTNKDGASENRYGAGDVSRYHRIETASLGYNIRIVESMHSSIDVIPMLQCCMVTDRMDDAYYGQTVWLERHSQILPGIGIAYSSGRLSCHVVCSGYCANFGVSFIF